MAFKIKTTRLNTAFIDLDRLGNTGDKPVEGAPVNTQQASFTPLPPSEGDTVEVNEGQWSSDTPITFTYQWQLDSTDIVGATLKTLLILPSMAGLALRCVVTATNAIGSAISATVSAVVEVVNYVAKLNGDGQYWQLSEPINIDTSNEFELEVDVGFIDRNSDEVYTIMGSGDPDEDFWVYKSASNNRQLTVRLYSDDFINFKFTNDIKGTLSISKNEDGRLTLSCQGETIVGVYAPLSGFSVRLLGYRGSYGYFYGQASDFKAYASGMLTNEIPLTNKMQGSLQLATVGTINATMIGYDPSVWVDESTL